MNPESNPNTENTMRVFTPVRYILIFFMMVCIIMTVSNLVSSIVPSWAVGVITGVMLFITVDCFYTYKNFRALAPLSIEWIITFGTQWIIIILFIKLFLSYAHGYQTLLDDLSLFVRGYLADLFTPEFAVTLFLAMFVWYLSSQFLDLFYEVEMDQAMALRADPTPLQSDFLPVHRRLANLVFGMGITLVILSALARLNLYAVFSNDLQAFLANTNRFTSGEAGTLLYFIFGLALLSQSRLVSLQTRWSYQHIPISSTDLSRRWGIYSMFLLLLLIVVVGFLPSGDSLGLFSLLVALFQFLTNILFLIVQLFIILITILFSLPFLLFGKSAPFANILPAPPPLPNLPEAPPTVVANNAIWELVRSIVWWSGLIAIIVFSLIWFMRQHGGLLNTFRKMPLINWFGLVWRWLRGNVTGAGVNLSRAILDGWQNIVSRFGNGRISPPSGWFSFRSLDPRRQVYFFFLAMIRRGGEQGFVRRPSQTPSEYGLSLERELPTVEEDVRSLTETFIKARYSRESVNAKDVNLVKLAWENIRRALQMLNDPSKTQEVRSRKK